METSQQCIRTTTLRMQVSTNDHDHMTTHSQCSAYRSAGQVLQLYINGSKEIQLYNLAAKLQWVTQWQFSEGAFSKWTTANTNGCIRIDISNCYLETKEAHQQEEVMFKKSVDPKGILTAMCTRRSLIHTGDNKVRFFTSSQGNKGECNWEQF